MAIFKGFKPEAMNKIANAMGYQGNMNEFQSFLEEDPQRQEQMNKYTRAAVNMARGGVIRMQTGGTTPPPTSQPLSPPPTLPGGGGGTTQNRANVSTTGTQTAPVITQPTTSQETTTPMLDESGNPILDEDGNPLTQTVTTPGIAAFTTEQIYNPGLPQGGVTMTEKIGFDTNQEIAAGTGQLTGSTANIDPAQAATAQAAMTAQTAANTMQASQAAAGVDAALQATEAAQTDPNDPRAQVTAAQQTTSSVGNLQAAQGNATLINNPVQRQIQAGELVTGTGVDAVKAAQVTAQTQAAAATANPSAQTMVAQQLDGLMQQFQGGATPAWAAGAMRSATAAMAARGLGASSMAGQAIVQAAMESMNASKISDVANQNFTAEQQVQLENSRAANTMDLNNLSNRQALVMSEAAALAQLDASNLNNRQQAAVQNAQSFLQMDMANLSNQQQTDMFKAQQRVQSLFTDQAAENAARQFNASSQNQVDQFFANLASSTAQFNASQQNAQSQFNAGQENTIERFNAELNNQRDQFNAQNQLVIAQSNAQWRKQIATADTAAINRANEINAGNVLDISKQAYNNLWGYYADTMEWAWTSAESELDRYSAMAIAELDAKTTADAASSASKSAAGSAIGGLIGTLGSALITCWVAREVYGKQNSEWFVFRTWLQYDAPKWFKKLYTKHGQSYAKLISKVPPLKWATKQLMDLVVERKRRKHNVQTI